MTEFTLDARYAVSLRLDTACEPGHRDPVG